jgi:SAM-dependent methyltransferase
MNQSDLFLSGEGDLWFARNKDKLGESDPVCALLALRPAIHPKRVLEVGCANGWRLKKLQKMYECRVSGVDTSADAITAARASGLEDVSWNKFETRQWLGGTFDMIIFGFCLYITSPHDWFKIVAEADRLLAHGGHLVIHDFLPEEAPFAVPYKHAAGLLSYHFDFTKLWNAHPWYDAYDNSAEGSQKELVTILRKNINAIPVRP